MDREPTIDRVPTADRQAEVRRIVVEVAARLAAGLSVDFDRVTAERPDLMPELGDELALQELTHRQFLAAQRAGPVANDADPGPVARRGGSGGFTPMPMSARLPAGGPPPVLVGPGDAGAWGAVPGGTPVDPGSGIFGRRAAAAVAAAGPAGSRAPADGSADGVPDIAVQGYRVVAELKRGGQATVFRAIQLATGREVALKVIEGGALLTRRRQTRFDREAEILAKLSHPNIVGILDRGRTAGGHVYLTMDFIDGPELDEWVAALPRALGVDGETDFPVAAPAPRAAAPRHGRAGTPAPAPPSRPPDAAGVLRLFVEVCDAVGEAHAQGVVHRDLKPSNVRVDRRRGEPYLLDFGLARLAAADDEEEWTAAGGARLDVTRTGQVMGSLPWLSPEQATGVKAAVTARSDVYALGVMLYESLTGVPPYPRDGTLAALLTAIQEHTPEPPSRLRADVSPAVDAVVMTALAKAPADRYADAGAMAQDLRAIVEGRPVAVARYRRPVPWWRRRAAVAAAAALAAAAGTVSIVVATRGGSGKGVASVGPGVGPPPTVAPATPPPPVNGWRVPGPATKGAPGVTVAKAPLAPTPDAPAPDAGVRIPVLQDAFVRDGMANQKVPQGAPKANNREMYRQLAVSTVPGTINKGHTRDAYLQFDLKAIARGRPIRSASLWLYGRSNPSQGWEGIARSTYVSAFRVADPTRWWDEKFITFYNRPFIVGYESVKTALGSVDVLVGPPRWWELDLSAFVRSERDAGTEKVTVVLHVVDTGKPDPARPDTIATFESGEAEHPPVLVVTYGP